jgi:hypothetical protein
MFDLLCPFAPLCGWGTLPAVSLIVSLISCSYVSRST